MSLWQSRQSEVCVRTLERSWQFVQFSSCFTCAFVTLPGISSVSTLAAHADLADPPKSAARSDMASTAPRERRTATQEESTAAVRGNIAEPAEVIAIPLC